MELWKTVLQSLHKEGIGAEVQHTKVIYGEEDHLWAHGMLGDRFLEWKKSVSQGRPRTPKPKIVTIHTLGGPLEVY